MFCGHLVGDGEVKEGGLVTAPPKLPILLCSLDYLGTFQQDFGHYCSRASPTRPVWRWQGCQSPTAGSLNFEKEYIWQRGLLPDTWARIHNRPSSHCWQRPLTHPAFQGEATDWELPAFGHCSRFWVNPYEGVPGILSNPWTGTCPFWSERLSCSLICIRPIRAAQEGPIRMHDSDQSRLCHLDQSELYDLESSFT